jgi:hypothetical protein
VPVETVYRVDPSRAAWRGTRRRLVVTDSARGLQFQVSGTGVDIWEALVAGTTVAGVVALLAERYDVDTRDATADVERFVTSLVDHGLVTALDTPAGSPAG